MGFEPTTSSLGKALEILGRSPKSPCVISTLATSVVFRKVLQSDAFFRTVSRYLDSKTVEAGTLIVRKTPGPLALVRSGRSTCDETTGGLRLPGLRIR